MLLFKFINWNIAKNPQSYYLSFWGQLAYFTALRPPYSYSVIQKDVIKVVDICDYFQTTLTRDLANSFEEIFQLKQVILLVHLSIKNT